MVASTTSTSLVFTILTLTTFKPRGGKKFMSSTCVVRLFMKHDQCIFGLSKGLSLLWNQNIVKFCNTEKRPQFFEKH